MRRWDIRSNKVIKSAFLKLIGWEINYVSGCIRNGVIWTGKLTTAHRKSFNWIYPINDRNGKLLWNWVSWIRNRNDDLINSISIAISRGFKIRWIDKCKNARTRINLEFCLIAATSNWVRKRIIIRVSGININNRCLVFWYAYRCTGCKCWSRIRWKLKRA